MAVESERCAWCGLIDLHLIDETCPSCSEKVKTVGLHDNLSLPKTKEYDNVPLGVEAANVKEVYREHH